MDFIPFDIKCYNKLNERFEMIFEPQLINEICQNGNFRTFKIDEEIIDVGTIITHIPLVISGSVKIMTEDNEGNELLLYYLEMADTCAVTLNCCTKKSKSAVRAIAESNTELLFVPVEKMEDWMIKYKSWRNYVLESYNTRLHEMIGAIDNIVFHSMEERLVNYLKEKALVTKTNIIHLTHQDIANDMHSSRVVVSRLMKKLEKSQMIEQKRNQIILLID